MIIKFRKIFKISKILNFLMSNENTLSKNQINKLVNSVKNVEKQIDDSFSIDGQSPEDRVLLLLLGPTGSGKTTLYYALTGQELYCFRENSRKLKIEARVKDKNFEIGHTGTAKTYIPGIKYDSNTEIIFCDCPGFFDNRGEIQDISNSFAISNVLSRSKKVKILLLASYFDLLSAKGTAFRESCEIVEKLLPDQNNFQSIIGLVITHVEPDLCSDDVFFLKDVECGNSWLLNSFKRNEKGADRNVFLFPSPTRKMIDKTYSIFNDKEDIIKFLKKGNTVQITPLISLSNKAKLMILSGIDSFGCLYTLLQHFVDQIRIDSSHSNEDLELWKERIYKLCRFTFKTPEEFVLKAKDIMPETNLYKNLYNQFLQIHSWRSFLEKIALEGVKIKDEIISRDSKLMSPVFLDITSTLSHMLQPVISILNTKIDLREIENKNIKADNDVIKIKQLNEQIQVQIKEEQDKAVKIQKELNDQLEIKKQDVIRAQNELEQARREAEAAARRGGGGIFGSICRFVVGAATAAWLL